MRYIIKVIVKDNGIQFNYSEHILKNRNEAIDFLICLLKEIKEGKYK